MGAEGSKLKNDFKNQILNDVATMIQKSKQEIKVDLTSLKRQRVKEQARIRQQQSKFNKQKQALQKEITHLKKILQEMKDLEKVNELLSKEEDINYLVDSKSAQIKKFIINKTDIVCNEDKKWCQLFGKFSILEKPINNFIIEKTQDRWISLGIVDKRYIQDQNSTGKTNCVIYGLQSGKIWVGGKKQKQSKAAKEGDKITMTVSGCRVIWSIAREILGSFESTIIGDPTIQWVPIIRLYHKGDKIQWC